MHAQSITNLYPSSKFIQHDIRQEIIIKKLVEFLSYMESSELEKEFLDTDGHCNGLSFMRFRAELSKTQDQFFDRLNFIASTKSESLKRMATLYSHYRNHYQEFVNADQKLLIGELKDCKSDKDKRTARERHYKKTEDKMVAPLNNEDKLLLKQAKDIYVFINSLLFAQDPAICHMYDANEKLINQKDFFDILDILNVDNYNHEHVRKSENTFGFGFTASELQSLFSEVLKENDLVRIFISKHAMFLLKKENKFILFDPNESHDFQYSDSNDFIHFLKQSYFDEKKSPESRLQNIWKLFKKTVAKTPQKEEYYHVGFQTYNNSFDEKSKNVPIPLILLKIISNFLFYAIYYYHIKNWIEIANQIKVSKENLENIFKIIIDDRIKNKTFDSKEPDVIPPLVMPVKIGWSEGVKKMASEHPDWVNKDIEGYTALHFAVSDGDIGLVKILMKLNVNKHAKVADGQNVLHMAASIGNVPILKYFIEDQKLDPHPKMKHGSMPAHYAAKKGHLPVLKYLINEHKFNPSTTNNNGLNCMHYAAKNNHPDIVRYLAKEHKICINAEDNDRCTPSHYAAQRGHISTLLCLAENAADFRLENFDGKTPFHLAAENGKWLAVLLMLLATEKQEELTHDAYRKISIPALIADKKIENSYDILNYVPVRNILKFAPEILPNMIDQKTFPEKTAELYFKDTEISLKMLALYLNKEFPNILNSTVQSKHNSEVIVDVILRQDRDNNETGLQTIATYAPACLINVVNCAIKSRKGLSNLLEALSKSNKDGMTGWETINKYASQYKDQLLQVILNSYRKQPTQKLKKIIRDLDAALSHEDVKYRGLCKEQFMFFGIRYTRSLVWQNLSKQAYSEVMRRENRKINPM